MLSDDIIYGNVTYCRTCASLGRALNPETDAYLHLRLYQYWVLIQIIDWPNYPDQ
jgi:hypothetical protein